MLRPQTEDEAAAIIRDHAARKSAIEIRGNGTRGGIGNPLDAADIVTTAALCGIVAYNPAEMVMTARAGTPVAEIESVLAENGQMLAFEPLDHRGIMAKSGEPTIGGAFAVNASGPRRIAAGAARDHLLGIRFVNGRGEVIRAGGRVMKNVTGLDLVKLIAGAHGTLGLVTEVTFKVLPKPAVETTLVLGVMDERIASLAMATAMAMPVEVSGAAHLPEPVRSRLGAARLPEGGATLLRIEGLARSVAGRADRLADALSAVGPLTRIEGEASAALWRDVRDARAYADGTQRPLWRLSAVPSEAHKLVAALRLETAVDGFYDWQGGLVWLRMDGDAEAGLVRGALRHFGGGHATLMRAEDALRAAIPAFEPEPAALVALSARVKRAFDPFDILNPGRMFKGDTP